MLFLRTRKASAGSLPPAVQGPLYGPPLVCAVLPLPAKKPPAPFVYDDKGEKLCNVCGRAGSEAGCGRGCIKEPLPEWIEKKDREALLLGQIDPEELAKKMLEEAE